MAEKNKGKKSFKLPFSVPHTCDQAAATLCQTNEQDDVKENQKKQTVSELDTKTESGCLESEVNISVPIIKSKQKKMATTFQAPQTSNCINPVIKKVNASKTKKNLGNMNEGSTEDPRKKKLEVSPMTEEQYDLLFKAVLHRVQNTPIEDLIASLPKKEKAIKNSKKKSAGSTVSSKVQKQIDEDSGKEDEGILGDTNKELDSENIEEVLKVPDNTQLDEINKSNHIDDFDAIVADDEQDIEESQIVIENAAQNCKVETHQNVMYMINFDSLSEEEIQSLNETTPEGSEMEYTTAIPPRLETPPRKNKKSSKHSSSKKLTPRQLQFSKEETQTSESKVKEKKQKQVKNVAPSRSKKEQMRRRDIEMLGTWVQCCEPSCLKWRYLPHVNDPMEIPERWTCSSNTDETCNSCENPEEEYNEDNHIFTKYTEGSIVWARMIGYPWWPAMIEIDPDTESYFELFSEISMMPSQYHVVFFDTKVSRAWVKSSSILPFNCKEELIKPDKKKKGPTFQKEVNAAKQNAIAALELPIQERLKKYSFSMRYVGKWGKVEDSDESPDVKLRGKSSSSKLNNLSKEEKRKSQKKRKRQNPDFDLDMLDSNTVDEILGNADSVLNGIEDVFDSLDEEDDCMNEIETQKNTGIVKNEKAETKKIHKDAKAKENQESNSICGNKIKKQKVCNSGANTQTKEPPLKKISKRKQKKVPEPKPKKATTKDIKIPKKTIEQAVEFTGQVRNSIVAMDSDIKDASLKKGSEKQKISKKSLFSVPENKEISQVELGKTHCESKMKICNKMEVHTPEKIPLGLEIKDEQENDEGKQLTDTPDKINRQLQPKGQKKSFTLKEKNSVAKKKCTESEPLIKRAKNVSNKLDVNETSFSPKPREQKFDKKSRKGLFVTPKVTEATSATKLDHKDSVIIKTEVAVGSDSSDKSHQESESIRTVTGEITCLSVVDEQMVPDTDSQSDEYVESAELNLDIPLNDDLIKTQEMAVQEFIPTMDTPIDTGNESDPFDIEE